MAQIASTAATAAALPPLEPPGTIARSQGLCTGPNAEFSFDAPIANSSQFVLPRSTLATCLKPADTVLDCRYPFEARCGDLGARRLAGSKHRAELRRSAVAERRHVTRPRRCAEP